jgi:hypothetical protein
VLRLFLSAGTRRDVMVPRQDLDYAERGVEHRALPVDKDLGARRRHNVQPRDLRLRPRQPPRPNGFDFLARLVVASPRYVRTKVARRLHGLPRIELGEA